MYPTRRHLLPMGARHRTSLNIWMICLCAGGAAGVAAEPERGGPPATAQNAVSPSCGTVDWEGGGGAPSVAESRRPAASRITRGPSGRDGRHAGVVTAAGWSEVLAQSIEGLVLVPATLRGPSGADTSGMLVLDTGAGFIGLDVHVAERLGVIESGQEVRGVELAEQPLSRLVIGGMQVDQLSPVLVFDAEI